MEKDNFIFDEGENYHEVYMVQKGTVSYVLPQYNNSIYVNVRNGDAFGVSDIMGCTQGDWFDHRQELKRLFTAQAHDMTELHVMHLDILHEMYSLFEDEYEKWIDFKTGHFKALTITKMKAIKKCAKLQNKLIKTKQ